MATAISATEVGSRGHTSTSEQIRERVGRWQWALVWLAVFAAVGVALVLIFPDSSSEDGGAHFLAARWAWTPWHHHLLVDVWGRPLFTVLYSGVAQLGYPAAKLLSVALSVGTAWQTWRVAEEYGFARAELAIPLLMLQPTYLAVVSETMTEPIFTFVLIVALRVHLKGRVELGAFLASLLPLARPEGPFIVALWGLWILIRFPSWRGVRALPLLGSGMLLWWLAALAITHDPLWIRHNAPWHLTAAGASHGPFWTYWDMRAQWIGPWLQYPFMVGLIVLIARRRALEAVSALAVVFLLHSTMWKLGLLNSEGYSRYLANVAPCTALITLAGWNAIADALEESFRRAQHARLGHAAVLVASAVVIAASARESLLFVDGQKGSRDAWAMREMHDWFRAHPRPMDRLGFSRSYMTILFDRDPWLNLNFTSDREANLQVLRAAPPRTLIFWDDVNGQTWYHLTATDIQGAGFELLRSKSYALPPLLPGTTAYHDASPRLQGMSLLYKQK